MIFCNQGLWNCIILGICSFLLTLGFSWYVTSANDSEYPRDLITLVNNDEEKGSITYTISHSNQGLEDMAKKEYLKLIHKLEETFKISLMKTEHNKNHNDLEYIGEKKLSNKATLRVKWVGIKRKGLNQYESNLLVNIEGEWIDEENVLNSWNSLKYQLKGAGISPLLNLTIEKEFLAGNQIIRMDNYLKSIVKSMDVKITDKYSDNSQTILEGFIISNKEGLNRNKIQLSKNHGDIGKVRIGTPFLLLN